MSAAAVMIFSLQDSMLHPASGIQNPTAQQQETQQVQTKLFSNSQIYGAAEHTLIIHSY
jgi:hypothetical protein